MAEIMALDRAIADLIHDGDSVALEGFSHLVPFAAGHEMIRQRRRDLTVIRMVPDLIVDQMIGMGTISRLVFSWAGNPGIGSLHRFRDALQSGWPLALHIEEHTHAGLANRYLAGASNLPFAILRGYVGTDLPAHTENVRFVTCPFNGEEVAAVAALRPDVAVIHAQRADREGNVQLWGITGVQREAVLAAKRSLVTVEEVVDQLTPVPHGAILPPWLVTCIAVAPGGAYPSYAQGYSVRDDEFFRKWDAISRDRDMFLDWMTENVLKSEPKRRTARDD